MGRVIKWGVGGVVILFVLLMAISAASGGGKATPTAEPASASAAPAARGTEVNIGQWKEVITFEGSGIKNTETFSIPTNEWRIVWDTKPGTMGDMNFQIYVYKANQQLAGVAANVVGANSDLSVHRGKGDYYLMINTGQPYKVTVEAKY